jgi:hypothetical protein
MSCAQAVLDCDRDGAILNIAYARCGPQAQAVAAGVPTIRDEDIPAGATS